MNKSVFVPNRSSQPIKITGAGTPAAQKQYTKAEVLESSSSDSSSDKDDAFFAPAKRAPAQSISQKEENPFAKEATKEAPQKEVKPQTKDIKYQRPQQKSKFSSMMNKSVVSDNRKTALPGTLDDFEKIDISEEINRELSRQSLQAKAQRPTDLTKPTQSLQTAGAKIQPPTQPKTAAGVITAKTANTLVAEVLDEKEGEESSSNNEDDDNFDDMFLKKSTRLNRNDAIVKSRPMSQMINPNTLLTQSQELPNLPAFGSSKEQQPPSQLDKLGSTLAEIKEETEKKAEPKDAQLKYAKIAAVNLNKSVVPGMRPGVGLLGNGGLDVIQEEKPKDQFKLEVNLDVDHFAKEMEKPPETIPPPFVLPEGIPPPFVSKKQRLDPSKSVIGTRPPQQTLTQPQTQPNPQLIHAATQPVQDYSKPKPNTNQAAKSVIGSQVNLTKSVFARPDKKVTSLTSILASENEIAYAFGGTTEKIQFKKREALPQKPKEFTKYKGVTIQSLQRMLDNEDDINVQEQEQNAAADKKEEAQVESSDFDYSKLEKLEALAKGLIQDTDTTRTSSIGSISVESQPKQLDILKIIELNEKANIPSQEKNQKVYLERQESMENADEEYKAIKREILSLDHMGELSRYLNDRNQQYYGSITCAAAYSSYLFIGIETGYIRVFDLQQQRTTDMKPLFDPKLQNQKVTSIDVAPGMKWLTAGYKNGTVALWDMQNYKLDRLITDIHNSEVTSAQVYHQAADGGKKEVMLVSAEANGDVKYIELKDKGFLRGTQQKAKPILEKNRLTQCLTVKVQRLPDKVESQWQERELVAFGNMSEVVVVQMRPLAEIISVKRPLMAKSTAVPYCDFGLGLTPGFQDYTCPLLAVAWDNIIQLIYFDEIGNDVRMDGFYVSDKEINSVFFVGNSLLAILVSQSKIKLLNTKKFYHGDYRTLQVRNEDDYRAQVKQVKELVRHAEIDIEDSDVSGCRMQVVRQGGEYYHNYNNTVIRYKRTLFYLRQNCISRCIVPEHSDFIRKMQQQSINWITVLKIALEIYTGEMKGFSNIPDFKDAREAQLLPEMQKLLMSSLTVGNTTSYRVASANDQLQIIIAIEFCIRIQALQFFFHDVYYYFETINMRSKFIRCLEPFILSGQLKNYILPPKMIGMIIKEYEQTEDYQVLEKLIQQLDLSQFPDLPDLEAVCQSKFMVSALIYIYIGRDSNQTSCMNILNTMYKTMLQARLLTQKSYQREDLQKLLKAPADKKYELEKSYLYIGYKFLWIIQMFLKGKRFPSGDLTSKQYRQHVLDIVNFISTEEYLSELLEFDPSMFFRVISRLFEGKPWQFLRAFGEHECILEPGYILPLFETKGQKKFLAESDRSILDSFHVFLLQVCVAQDQERMKADEVDDEKIISVDYTLIYESIKSVLTSTKVIQKQSQSQTLRDDQIDESLIIGAIRAVKLNVDDIDTCLNIIGATKRQSLLINIVMELYESQLNYKEAFKCLIQSDSQQHRLFDWVNQSIENLQSNTKLLEEFKLLLKESMLQICTMEIKLKEVVKDVKRKGKIHQEIEEPKNLCCKQTFELLKSHFGLESVFFHKFVMQDLPTNEHAEYHFLRTYIILDNKDISETIRDSVYMREKKKQADMFKQLLVSFIKKLCKFDADQVEYWVEKDYFPTQECLEIVKESKNLLAEAKILEKMNKRSDAINMYLEVITKLDIRKFTDQLLQTKRDMCNFGEVSHLSELNSFDTTLEKACKIAEKKTDAFGRPLPKEQGVDDEDEAFYTILEFLSQYIMAITQKLDTINKKMQFKLKDKELKVDRTKDLILNRIQFVLERENMPLSLRNVAERLGLEIESIKKLCQHKMDTLKDNRMRLESAWFVQENDILFMVKNQQASGGFKVRVARNQNEPGRDMCPKCNKTLLNATLILPCRVFLCGHLYHSSCLQKTTTCLLCDKTNVLMQDPSLKRKDSAKSNSGKANDDDDFDDDGTVAAMIKVQTPAQIQRAQARAMADFDKTVERESLKKGDFFLCEAPKFKMHSMFMMK